MTTRLPERSDGGVTAAPEPTSGVVPPPDIPTEPRREALRYWLADHRVAVAGWLVALSLAIVVGGLFAVGIIDPQRLRQPETSFGTSGANLVERGSIGPELEVGRVGSGESTTFIVRGKRATGPQAAVIFLHGFGSSLVTGYEPWIEHLAREGLTVIFPSWQQPPYPTDGSQDVRANMFRGVRLALDAVPIRGDQVAVLGFSAGGALAFDYAALASAQGLPSPGLVFSVYPARGFAGSRRTLLDQPSVRDMGRATRVVTYVSRRDREAGTRWGRAQYEVLAGRGADLRDLVYVKTPGMGGHFAPAKVSRAARTTFWQPLDRELEDWLRIRLQPDNALIRAVRIQHDVEQKIRDDRLAQRRATGDTSGVIDGGRGTTDATGAQPKLPTE